MICHQRESGVEGRARADDLQNGVNLQICEKNIRFSLPKNMQHDEIY